MSPAPTRRLTRMRDRIRRGILLRTKARKCHFKWKAHPAASRYLSDLGEWSKFFLQTSSRMREPVYCLWWLLSVVTRSGKKIISCLQDRNEVCVNSQDLRLDPSIEDALFYPNRDRPNTVNFVKDSRLSLHCSWVLAELHSCREWRIRTVNVQITMHNLCHESRCTAIANLSLFGLGHHEGTTMRWRKRRARKPEKKRTLRKER